MGTADRPGRKVTDKEVFAIADIMQDLRTLTYRAIEKHASMHSPHEGHSVLREEVEELWDHVKADTGRTREAYAEALHVAGMAIRYALDLIPEEERQL